MKEKHTHKIYKSIKDKLETQNYQRIFLTKVMRSQRDIHMAFSKNQFNCFTKFYRCRICKGDHTIFECSKAQCGVCKQKGHLTRSCKQIKCRFCKGNHLTTRCSRIKCNFCGKKGHIAKRCHQKSHAKSHAK